MIEIGTILQNRYRVEKQIGQGGMGKVYVALDERFNSTVAIKETVFEDKNLRKAFEREARLLNSLKHLALPRVSDHFIEGDGQFIVMEYIAGEDLAEMMVRNGAAFSLENVLNWANQLCDALEYLHSRDIIHRDIKPQNLKLTPGGQIVLLDFGLAKGSPTTDSQQNTVAKSIFGYSRSYASLEQIQGTGTEPRSDLYSLGATLYHLLTGIPPADALTRAMNVLNGQSDPLIAANLINGKVPRGVAEILQKTMALNANERPVSAVSMRQMLKECDLKIDSNAVADLSLQNPFTADLLTQETKIKAATTNLPAHSQSELGTKVSSENVSRDNPFKTRVVGADAESIVTSVRTKPEDTNAPKRSRFLTAAVAGGLLLVGTAISATYLYNPRASRTQETAPAAVMGETKGTFVIAPAESQAVSNANVMNVNTVLATKDASLKPTERQNPLKSVEASKNNAREARNQPPENVPPHPAKPKEPETSTGEVIIRDERIETENMIIDEKGIRLKKPPVPARQAPFTWGRAPVVHPPVIDPKTLTRDQIKELERLKTITKNGVFVIKTPTPKPSTKPTP